MTLVVDGSAIFGACLAPDGFHRFTGHALVAPGLLWSEVRSTLHERQWRGMLSREQATEALGRLESAPIESRTHRRLGREAWHIADELGWAKTYDAEYIALARLLGCPLVTLDEALRRSAGRLVRVVGPADV